MPAAGAAAVRALDYMGLTPHTPMTAIRMDKARSAPVCRTSVSRRQMFTDYTSIQLHLLEMMHKYSYTC